MMMDNGLLKPIDDGLDGLTYLDLPVENELSNDGGGERRGEQRQALWEASSLEMTLGCTRFRPYYT
jgi:hypothetical protein